MQDTVMDELPPAVEPLQNYSSHTRRQETPKAMAELASLLGYAIVTSQTTTVTLAGIKAHITLIRMAVLQWLCHNTHPGTYCFHVHHVQGQTTVHQSGRKGC